MSERVVAVVQARMGSTRLPGKVLLPLAGEHVLTHDVRRLQATETVETVVVATSTAGRDDIVARYAERAGAAVHRGPEDDVLGRLHAAAREADADVVVRATGDDPLVAPAVVDACVERVHAGADYAANTIDRTFPQGLVVEAFSMDSFDRVEAASDDPHQREHVTQYYLEHPGRFDRENVAWEEVYDRPLPCDRRDVRLALDEPDDYELLRGVYEGVEPDERGILPVRDTIEYALAEGLTEWNSHVGQTKVQGDE